MREIWKDVKDFEGIYQISNLGNFKSVDRINIHKDRWGNSIKYKIKGKPKRYSLNNKGYCVIQLYKNGKTKHYLLYRLVAEAFIPNPNNLPEVNHKDENKLNNCIDNLHWCTRIYNNTYGIQSKEGRRKTSKFRMKKVNQYNLKGELLMTFDGIRVAEEKTGINNRNICGCCKGKTKTAGGYVWRYADDI